MNVATPACRAAGKAQHNARDQRPAITPRLAKRDVGFDTTSRSEVRGGAPQSTAVFMTKTEKWGGGVWSALATEIAPTMLGELTPTMPRMFAGRMLGWRVVSVAFFTHRLRER